MYCGLFIKNTSRLCWVS